MRRVLVALLVSWSFAAAAKPARLVLVISVDGMGSELFVRMRPKFKGGFAQLSNGGAYYPNARYAYAKTSTAPGHATLSTGANPWRHAVVSNRIVLRASGKSEPILYDAQHPLLEAPPKLDDVSPEHLRAETLADRVRVSTQGRGKVVAVSVKARSAIAFAGRLGQPYWFSDATGKFVSGTFYVKEFPDWVKAFNDKRLTDAYFGKTWELLLAPKEYVGEDDRAIETDKLGLGRVFPHAITGGLPGVGPQYQDALSYTPMMSDVMVQFAKAAIDGEQLGKDEVPDVLAISFSGIDRVQHLYGPYSWEVQDAMLRLDRQLAELIAAAEKAAGSKGNVLIALSADHGSAALPEEWAAAGLPAARLNPETLGQQLGEALKARFGVEVVAGVEEDGVDVYLNPKAIADKKLDGAVVRRAAADWLRGHAQIAHALARDDLFSPAAEGLAGPYLRALQLGYFPERSGDVLFVPKPWQVVDRMASGTNHGSPSTYDSVVPMLFAGRGVKPGTYQQQVDPVDFAPTIAALIELTAPGQAEGVPRWELFSTTRPAAAAAP